MGYGLDTTKYADRKWGNVITWKGEAKGKLSEALGIWQLKLGITFSQTTDAKAGFVVEWGSTCSWSSGSAGVGCPAGDKKPGTLNLKDSATLGTMLHEIGHLLGLSHEQDHPESRAAWYRDHARFDFELQGAIDRAVNLKAYGAYDPGSVMHYPGTHYHPMTAPTAGDVAAVKMINGWT